MPELPEAETIVRDLRPHLTGEVFAGAEVTHADILGPGLTTQKLSHDVAGRRVDGVDRRGKNVVFRLAGGRVVAVNLGMTGRLVMSHAARAGELRHIAVRFPLEGGGALLFDDMRRFGRVDLFEAAGWRARGEELGAEPLDDAFTAEHLRRLTRASRVPIRNFLLDQRKVAGVGNIYANEALFLAGIRPTRRARTLTRAEIERLHAGLRAVLEDAIAARGTTLRDYRDGSGAEGTYEPRLRVYDRAGASCPNCGSLIKRVVLTNRSAFYCPRCQR
ncbi:MAG: bifunctional DNA-formamidopyrimidine glycosylase/DNA-(apurinic or apyrimidinic site) lyase [Longimicrobiales bacterium]